MGQSRPGVHRQVLRYGQKNAAGAASALGGIWVTSPLAKGEGAVLEP